jgi:pimeloyl-ACP methyl ester carboxylesterase
MSPASRAEAPSGDGSAAEVGEDPTTATQANLDPLPSVIVERQHDVAARGVRLRVTEWHKEETNAESTRTVLALPGLLAPRTALEPMARLLAEHFRVVAVDLPGFGDSEKPPPSKYPYTLSAFCEGLADLFGALSLPRAHLLGHGFGGTVALHFAAEHPELIDRLCLVAPMGDLAERPVRQALLLPVVGGLVFRQLAGRALFRAVYRSWVNGRASGPALDEYYESMTPPAARAALLATLRNGSGAQTLIADCRRVRAQTLFVWGANDRVFPITEGRAISREMPHAGFEVLPLGHAPHEEAPERVASIVERFFAGRRAGFA